MKNLKKVLALVLVVATLMGLGLSASAKSFSDGEKISYKEAVDVLSEIKVIDGMPDGTFDPAGNVTRAQMAKMVAYIVAGGEDVGNLYKNANTFSDCTSHWAKGYIAYANKTGIVSGIGGGKFDPEGSVTGVQAAKMLLVALGYNATTEGFTGPNWIVNTMSAAKKAGLVGGLPRSMDFGAKLSREAAAQMMFNALEATMVKYDTGDISITNPDGSAIVIGGSKADKVVAGAGVNYSPTLPTSSDGYVQLCEEYFPELIKANVSTDKFGAPGYSWKYDKGTPMIYAAEPILTYNTAIKGKDLYADVKSAGYEMESTGTATTATVTVYKNGVSTTETIVSNTTTLAFTGNGVEVEVYDSGANDVIYLVVKTYAIGEITNVIKDNANTAADDRALVLDNGVRLDKDTTGFEAIYASAKIGDRVISAGSKAAYKPTVVTGKITNVNTGDSTVTAGGTTYKMAKTSVPSSFSVGKEDVTVYLDKNGYIMDSTASGTSTAKTFAVLDFFQGTNADGKMVWKAKVVAPDGAISSVELSGKNVAGTTLPNGTYDTTSYADGTVHNYTITDGKYNLTPVANAISTTNPAATFGGGYTVTSSTKKMQDSNGGTYYYFASDVKFIFLDVAGGKATVKDGVSAFTSAAGAFITKTVGSETLISTVYVLAAASEGSTKSDELIYVKGATTGNVLIEDKDDASGYKTYYTYDAYVNGVKVDNFYSGDNSATQGFYKNEKLTSGAYKLIGNGFTPDTKLGTQVAAAFTAVINGNVAAIGGADYAVGSATVTDLTGAGVTDVNTLKGMLANGDTIAVSIVYAKDGNVVSNLYVTSIT